MKKGALLVLALQALLTGRAQLAFPENRATHTQSGQFIVQGRAPSDPPSFPFAGAGARNLFHVEPTLLAVSCERIKQSLARELGSTEHWRGRIFLTVIPASSDDDGVGLTCAHFQDGWQYQLQVPDAVRRDRYVRAVVQALLLEMANRKSADRVSEVPLWLIEGLTRQLLASREMEIILPPAGQVTGGSAIPLRTVDARPQNPIKQMHDSLQASPALSFDQLSWPSEDQLEGDAASYFCVSSEFFVNELMRLPDGKACLRAMLAQLPDYYNWQLAFLSAFKAHFSRPRDVEKWWALHVAHFIGRDFAQTWPAEESWAKLDQVVRSPVEVRTGTNDLPLHQEVTLQTIIRQWEPRKQTPVLRRELTQLAVLRPRVAPALTGLVNDYHQALEAYVKGQERKGLSLGLRSRKSLSEQTIRQLDTLDDRRAALRPARPAVASNSDR